jgi:hypothetical protein
MIEMATPSDPKPDPLPPPRGGPLPGDPPKPPKYVAQAAGICWEEEEELVGEQAGDPTKRPK